MKFIFGVSLRTEATSG